MSASHPERPQVAVLGLGIVGSRAAKRLNDAGWRPRLWNRTPKEVAGFHADPAAAVRGADFVALYLKDAPAVREVFAAMRPGLSNGMIVVNHSTVDLETTHWLAARCAELGCEFLDAPFTGSREAAAAGNLVYYLGGDAVLAEQVAEFLRVTSRASIHCGAVGAATVVKLATNLVSACTVQALSEAMAIAGRHGVEPALFTRAVGENACGSPLAAMKLPGMAAGAFETHFSLGNMAKDSRYARDLAAKAGLETPAIDAVSRRMHDLADQGWADLDYSALAKPYLEA